MGWDGIGLQVVGLDGTLVLQRIIVSHNVRMNGRRYEDDDRLENRSF